MFERGLVCFVGIFITFLNIYIDVGTFAFAVPNGEFDNNLKYRVDARWRQEIRVCYVLFSIKCNVSIFVPETNVWELSIIQLSRIVPTLRVLYMFTNLYIYLNLLPHEIGAFESRFLFVRIVNNPINQYARLLSLALWILTIDFSHFFFGRFT